MTMTEPQLKDGRVVAIAGPGHRHRVPPGLAARDQPRAELDITLEDTTDTLIAEVAQQIGEGRVRAICMKPTDGLTRGTPVRNTGHGVQVPVGDQVLGHIWNVWGAPLDADAVGLRRSGAVGDPPSGAVVRLARAAGPDVRDRHQGHRPADPLRAGRQDRPVRRRRRGQDRAHHRDDPPGGPAARRCVGVRRRGRAHP